MCFHSLQHTALRHCCCGFFSVRRFTFTLLTAAAFLLVPATASSQDDAPNVRYKKKTEIDFEDVNVDGALKVPHGSYLLEKRQSRFNPLIRLKENFNKEMLDSVQQVR